jgi:hypothetical protein
MKSHFRGYNRRPLARPLRPLAVASLGTLLPGLLGAVGCLSRPIETLEPRTTSTVFERLSQSSINAIDVLLAIDNSRSMADKQEILALAVPDLVKGLVNPRCIDDAGVAPADQPRGPLDPCPVPGTRREFEPIVDIHIGIISSSLGGHGADSCPNEESSTCATGSNSSNNDKGHLLARADACSGGKVPTYSDKGFLAWDPKQKLTPKGERDIEIDEDGDGRALVPDLRDMVKGVGQTGCGFESQLESFYRFLIDPEPYETIAAVNGRAVAQGVDSALLAQRRDFLRPGSLLAIILLTDENDCSIIETGPYFIAGQLSNPDKTRFHLPRPRAICATNPDDPCCRSCGQDPGECGVDPTCFNAKGELLPLDDATDPSNLRCWDQKRRFGLSFLYPIERYTKGLTSPVVPNRAGELVPNPLFSDLDPTDDKIDVRGPNRVYLAGIVGVPWQDVARDPTDLKKGLKTAQELKEELPSGGTTWDLILGDPANGVPPKDPHMIESIDPRAGLVPPDMPATDPISGRERPNTARDDLQYACIFDLTTPRDCSNKLATSCDCDDPANTEPLCEENPNSPGARTLQVRAKAFPGTRELELLRDVGDQGIVASVCPAQASAPDEVDFGYRPAIGAIVEQLKARIRGQCLPRTLTPKEDGSVPCLIIEARRVEEAAVEACNRCEEGGRRPVSESGHPDAAAAAMEDPAYDVAKWNCFCEIEQVKGADKQACQNNPSPAPTNPETGDPVSGWCYVDAMTVPPTGNEAIVENCPATERRLVRFVGDAGEKPGSTLFITCSGDTSEGRE